MGNFENDQDLLQFIRENCRIFRGLFKTMPKDQMRNHLNEFFSFYLNHTQTRKELYWQVYMEYIEVLNYYGQDYNCRQTFENIINDFKKDVVRNQLYNIFPIRSKLVISVTWIMYFYQVKSGASDSELRSKNFIDPILKAKAYLSKIYGKYLANKSLLNTGQLIRCLESLGICYGALSRWYEALYYLNLAESLEANNPNVYFTKAKVLDRIQSNTCISYNKMLMLEVIDTAKKIYSSDYYPDSTIKEFEQMASGMRKVLRENKISIPELRKHKSKAIQGVSDYSDYEKFCIENRLFLNEHSQYCQCRRATRDDIEIKSSHSHTQIDYVKPFESIMNALVFDYVMARQNYYDSLDNSRLTRFSLRSLVHSREGHKYSIRISLLKDSFRLCYSIFDSISLLILEALEIDYSSIRKENDNKRPIHFTNIWDDLVSDEHFDGNYYVQTLYSIAYDIKTRTSGHKEFKDIRNAMEHKAFWVLKRGGESVGMEFSRDSYYEIEEEELYDKTLLLLVYTKSLIMSFTYFMRRVTVKKDPRTNDKAHLEKG